jgi:23S rRNA (cytosine1962-C5)-methyltransferase
VSSGLEPGDDVEVRDAHGKPLGRGLYSPGSAIPVRLYTRDVSRRLDGGLLRERIQNALSLRAAVSLPSEQTSAYRVVHGEGDELPGLVVDRLGSVLSVQVGTIGMQRRLDTILDALDALGAAAIVDRTSERTAKLEGFSTTGGVLRGDANIGAFEFRERGFEFRIPLELGQKTGYYVDQRPLRARIEELAKGRRVLDAYSFVGSCSLAAVRGGAASVRAIDSSKPAVQIGSACAALNQLEKRIEFVCMDAREALREAADTGGYDLVICDPPKLAPNRGAQRRALDSMRKLAAAGARAVTSGGLFVLCSCSAAIGHDELARALALGARDAAMRATVLERVFQGPDHPVPAAFPEGLYLTSLIARVEHA